MTSPVHEFSYWFTKLVTDWNMAERGARAVLAHFLGDTPQAHAICFELKNVQLTNGLMAASKVAASEELNLSIQGYCASMERMREYRNFVVHGMQEMPDHTSQRGEGVSVLAIEQAKGSMKVGSQAVGMEDIEAVAFCVDGLRIFAELLLAHMKQGAPLPSPDTLPSLKRLDKNLRSHPLFSPPPQPSQG